MKYTEILERKIAKKKILQNFLGVDEEVRKLMVASVQKDNEQKVTFVKDTIKRIYELHGVGGPLHIVLDDCNMEDHHIIWCLENTIGNYFSDNLSDEENQELNKLCKICAEYLLEMSYSKRKKVIM